MMYLFHCKSFVSAFPDGVNLCSSGKSMKPLCLTPLKKSAYQTQAKTLSEPPRLKGGEGRCAGAAEVIPSSTSLDPGALKAHRNT